MRIFLCWIFLFLIMNTLPAINPVREYKMTPDKVGLEYTEQKITTSDGYDLNSWWMEPEPANRQAKTIVIAYGDGGNMGFVLAYAMGLVRNGYTVLTFDYRGFGHSDDFEIDRDYYYYNEFATDLVTAIKWAKQQKRDHEVGVLAFSMGTAMATLSYEQEPFHFLIGEGVVYDAVENVERIKKMKERDLILPEGAGQLKEKAQEVNIPVLFFASQSDKITSLEDTKQWVGGRENGQIIEYDGAHLSGAATLGLGAYIDTIHTWLKDE